MLVDAWSAQDVFFILLYFQNAIANTWNLVMFVIVIHCSNAANNGKRFLNPKTNQLLWVINRLLRRKLEIRPLDEHFAYEMSSQRHVSLGRIHIIIHVRISQLNKVDRAADSAYVKRISERCNPNRAVIDSNVVRKLDQAEI